MILAPQIGKILETVDILRKNQAPTKDPPILRIDNIIIIIIIGLVITVKKLKIPITDLSTIAAITIALLIRGMKLQKTLITDETPIEIVLEFLTELRTKRILWAQNTVATLILVSFCTLFCSQNMLFRNCTPTEKNHIFLHLSDYIFNFFKGLYPSKETEESNKNKLAILKGKNRILLF